VRVLVIDDSEVFLEAVLDIIDSIPEFRLVGQAASGEDGVALAMRVHPDLVLLDLILPGMDGLETCRRLRSRHPSPFIVLCSVEEDPRRGQQSMPCAEAPFVRKTALSRAMLLSLWHEHEVSDQVREHPADTLAYPIAGSVGWLDADARKALLIRNGRMEVDQMSIGPVELLVVKFPGSHFRGEIAPALRQLVENETIRVIDILFAMTNDAGEVKVIELDDLDVDTYGKFDAVVRDVTGLLSHDDVTSIGQRLGPNSTGVVMLFENVWATRLRDAILAADGELVMVERIPKKVIDELVAAAA
jgi:CheY-like chemotaxis protein